MDRLVQLAQLRLGLAAGGAYGAEQERGRCFLQTRDRDRHELIRVPGRACQRGESVHGDPSTTWSEAGGAAGDLGHGIGHHDGRVRGDDGGLRDGTDRIRRATDDRQPADRLDDGPVGPILGSSEHLPPSAERLRCGRGVSCQELVPASLHHRSALQEILLYVSCRPNKGEGEQRSDRPEDERADEHGTAATLPALGPKVGGVSASFGWDGRPALRAAPHVLSDRSRRAPSGPVIVLVGSHRPT